MTLTTAPETTTIAPGPAARFGVVVARLARRPLAMFGLVVIALVVVAAVAAPIVAPFRPTEQLFDGLTLEGAPLPPNASSGSAPTCSAATFSRGSSTAPAPR